MLTCDWSAVSGLLVSGGEDCTYRVWDAYGRHIYSSADVEYSITSVAWAPNGRYFAVGCFNMLRVCDHKGWSYGTHHASSGSVCALSWTADSTTLAAAGASGAVLFGCIGRRELSRGEWEVCEDGEPLQTTHRPTERVPNPNPNPNPKPIFPSVPHALSRFAHIDHAGHVSVFAGDA